jgi:hypothetical protein
MWGNLKITYKTPHHTMRGPTKAYITTACEICTLLRYYAALSDNSTPSFLDNLLVPASWAKKSKIEHRTTEVNWHNLIFGGFVHHLLLETHDAS